ncbi:MAG TPA: hypothetical protein VMH61_03730 [Candidatus Acidoferrales bacterium]|nr:hypothetical protein [Candidatus Acidoferrales bacterium]
MLALLALALLTPAAGAKKFRYASGPQPPADSTLSVANPYLEPVVRSRGPRVPFTNLELVQLVADSAAAHALRGAPLESGAHVVLAPVHEHPLNFALEQALLLQLTQRGVEVTVRHTRAPDDSVALLYGRAGDPLLEYTVGSARITYMRLVGFLPGRVKIERQSLIEGSLSLRDPVSSRILWTSDLKQNFVDRFPRNEVGQVEDSHYPDLKDDVPGRNVDKVVEPITVVAIVSGLIALFFQNRP